MNDKNSRRDYLKGIGASAFAGTLAVGDVSARVSKNEGQDPGDKIPHDMAVYNNSRSSVKLMVVFKPKDDSGKSKNKQITLPGLNDPAHDQSEATFKRKNLNLQNGTTYVIEASAEGMDPVSMEWYVPKEGIGNQSMRVSVNPDDTVETGTSTV